MIRALDDAMGINIQGNDVRGIGRELVISQARIWFERPAFRDDFEEVCTMADLHPDQVRAEYRRRMEALARGETNKSTKQSVLDAYLAGERDRSEIARRAGTSVANVCMALCALRREGHDIPYMRGGRS